ncbi:lipase, putative [Trypanosoma cruzi]|uniref:Lipase, putative n=1 Tax=Trypanosoma cruzi (strain CL Brener) TaxID=353153 RepID=Q4CQ28_TRYCC|nr:lipase, putative [Trypanosoma cruzi]EAN82380.1 lipase, putative [Trypanosoma cruzi]|eukprot:XP_804231.1 lipase [Trypanosoma cruzi strain CL Brener]
MRRRRTMTVVVVLLILLCGEDVRADYSVQLATTALYYAKAAYCKAEAISGWTCASCARNPGLQRVRVFTNAEHSTQAFVGVNESMIVVSFRGTRDVTNWLHNLDFIFAPYTHDGCVGCLVHAGFNCELKSLWTEMWGYLQELVAGKGIEGILITGHSLGGAMATLAAANFMSQNSLFPSALKVLLYTFGQPRVGNEAFINWLLASFCRGGHESYRVTHKRDPVPHVPPMFVGYLHLPNEVWYDNDGDTVHKNCNDVFGTPCSALTTKEDPNCSGSVLPIKVEDHLKYLGVCTRCSCDPGEAMSDEELRLPPELERIVAMDYVYQQSRNMRRFPFSSRFTRSLEARRRK